MKTSKKVLAIVLAVALVLALSVTAFAAQIDKKAGVTGPASITIQLPTTPDGYTADNTYKIYKVFDAGLAGTGENDGISYTLAAGHSTAPAGFVVDAAGNVKYAGTSTNGELTDADIAAIKAYVNENDLVATVTTTAGDTEFTVSGLPYGYYYINTTTGSVVTVNSTKPNATVSDKNEIPPVDKNITDANIVEPDGDTALAEVGSSVEYTASITTKKGAENYVFHDKMSTGLAYNGDIKVYVNGTEVAPSSSTFTVGANSGDTLTVTFDNEYIASLDPETVITFKYTATVTSDALQIDPATNSASLSYGHNPGDNHTPPVITEVYNAKISVIKTDDNATNPQPLAGAEFVLKNSDGKYYAIDSNGALTWVDTVEAATKRTSGADGTVPAFGGLANGTYTLVEVKAPAGYNVAEDQDFTINEHDYTAENLIKSATVKDSKGQVLPSTGGIGTTIFYIVGSVLLLAAAIVLIARRRTAADAA